MRDEFKIVETKWKKSFVILMSVGFFEHMRNNPTCKDKWGVIFGNFKKIFDHWLGTWQNENDWAMNS